mmetsp:Transcript_32090/g.74082  ORF Transcript_32090/g.74082 Transcript_32090/m.74082 type:complete len:86 (+) Transcript_32090:602-859(+)
MQCVAVNCCHSDIFMRSRPSAGGSTTPSPDFNPLHHLQEGVPTYKVKKSGAFIQVEVDVAYKQNYESNYWRGILDAQGKTDGGYY